MAGNAKDTFKEIMSLTEKTADLMDQFTEFDTAAQEEVLTAAFAAQIKNIDPEADVPITLVRTAEMLVGVTSGKAVSTLCTGLGSENATVRMLCGDALVHAAEDDLELIKPAVEEVLKKGGTAAEEMPFVLLEVDDPEIPNILEKFLKSSEAEVVAAAIEAIIEIGDPDSEKALKTLVNDKREVALDEGSDDETTTIGQLAKDAIAMLSEQEEA
jgi:HEAT repeat protein